MPGLARGINVLAVSACEKTWMAGTSPAMTAGVKRRCSSRSVATIDAALELTIDVERAPVGERQDLHHDHAGDARRRIDPVVGIVQTGPGLAVCRATLADRIDIDHAGEAPAQADAGKEVDVIGQ